MTIQHNLPALNTSRVLGITNRRTAGSLEKLSSGFRINRAADDAAGLAISEKMRGQMRGLSMAETNTWHGIDLIKTAEGGMQEIHTMLARMREFSVQSSNGSYQDSDREQLEAEYGALKLEIDRICEYSNYNNIKLLNGDLTRNAAPSSILYNVLAEPSGIMPTAVQEITPFAAPVPDFTININAITNTSNADYEFDNGVLTIKSDKTFAITGSGAATTNRIVVNSGVTANIVLDNANINAGTGAALDMRNATVNLWLEGSSALRTTNGNSAGIQTTGGILVINGTGSLTAAGSTSSAGIGGGTLSDGGTITINGGTITATGGIFGAGIGGGNGGVGGIITINGGTVTATGGFFGAGIGGGNSSVGGTITISGGNITATGDNGGAGIGGGNGGGGGNVTISGGNITAGGTGIGGGTGNNSTGTTKFTDKNLINTLFNSIKNTIQDIFGTPIYRTQITGTAFAPNTNISYTIGGSSYTSRTDGSGNLYLYLPAADNAKEIKIAVGGNNYAGTLTVGTNHNNIVALAAVSDTAPPIISSLSANRTADDKATVSFNISEAGQYYYILSKKGEPAPNAADLLLTVSKNCNAGTQTISLTGLDPDEYEIYILAKDAAGNESSIYRIGISEYDPARPPDPPQPPVTPSAPTGKGLVLQVGANSSADQSVTVYIENMNTSSIGIKDTNGLLTDSVANSSLTTIDKANSAISVLDSAINMVSNQRASLGAMQNRLEHTLNNLGVAKENLTAAESTIRDVNIAKEMIEFTKNSILTQAAQAMLAQANQFPNGILSLLR